MAKPVPSDFLTTVKLLLIVSLLLLASPFAAFWCWRWLEYSTLKYADLQDLQARGGPVERWEPLPATATEIRVQVDSDAGEAVMRLSFAPVDPNAIDCFWNDRFQSVDAAVLDGQRLHLPVSWGRWWHPALRGELQADRLHKDRLRIYARHETFKTRRHDDACCGARPAVLVDKVVSRYWAVDCGAGAAYAWSAREVEVTPERAGQAPAAE